MNSFDHATTPPEGGFFMPDLNRSFEETIEQAGISPAESIQAGWTASEIARAIASMPPFCDAVAERVLRYWRQFN